MPTVTLDFDPTLLAAVRKSPDEFAKELRVAAAVLWYSRGVVSQEMGARIAGVSRAEFIDALWDNKVEVSQVTAEGLVDEVRRAGEGLR